jgi:hypothetical protein
MEENPEEKGRISAHSKGLGTVTQEMIRERAREIALINGRSPHHLSPLDLSEAKRELLGEVDFEPPEDNVPTSERWDPVPGTEGRSAPLARPPDEQTTTND